MAGAVRRLLLLLLLMLPAVAQSQDYTCQTNNGTITDYTGSGGELAIPDAINELLPNGITSIGNSTFYRCYSLTSPHFG